MLKLQIPRENRMNVHKHARLTPRGRERVVRQVASERTPEAVVGRAPALDSAGQRHRFGLGHSLSLELCALSRRPSKPLADWQISTIGKVARHIGTVQAARSRRSYKATIRKYDIAPEHRDRVAARPTWCGRIRPPARPSRHSDLGRKSRRFQPAARVSWGHHCGSLAPRRKTRAISLLHYPGHDPVVFTGATCEIGNARS